MTQGEKLRETMTQREWFMFGIRFFNGVLRVRKSYDTSPPPAASFVTFLVISAVANT